MHYLISGLTAVAILLFYLYESKKAKPWYVVAFLLALVAGVSAWCIYRDGPVQYLTDTALPIGAVFLVVFAVDRIGARFVKDEQEEENKERKEDTSAN